MGIDIYMAWDGMTKEDKERQVCGFEIDKGNVGYLREAYHGEPYATMVLVPEAFESPTNKARIPSKRMKKRLPEVLEVAMARALKIYKHKIENPFEDPITRSYIEFVVLAEKKERETRRPVIIYASY